MSLDEYTKAMGDIFEALLPLLRLKAHCVINVPDMWWEDRRVTIHIALVEELRRRGYELRNVIIWDGTKIVNRIDIFGWPSNYITMCRHLSICWIFGGLQNEALFQKRVGLGPLDPEPYWGLDDLVHLIGAKAKNCLYLIADTKIEEGREFFKYTKLLILSGFSFDGFLKCIEEGTILVDFDAWTAQDHGTKFRVRQNNWARLYKSVQEIMLPG